MSSLVFVNILSLFLGDEICQIVAPKVAQLCVACDSELAMR